MTARTTAPTMSSTAAAPRELHVEQLLGRPVRDRDGKKVGRIEEMIAEIRGTDWVLTEVHLGPAALLERLVDISSLVPVLDRVARRFRPHYRARWDQLDFSDPDHPRVVVRRTELERLSKAAARQ